MRFNFQLLVLPVMAGIFMLSQGCGEPAPKETIGANISVEVPDWYKGPGSVNPANKAPGKQANKGAETSGDKAK